MADQTLHTRLLAELAGFEDSDPPDRALRAVVALHAPQETFPGSTTRIGYTACCGCDVEGYEWEYPEWPCSTIRTIAEALGVPLEAENRG